MFQYKTLAHLSIESLTHLFNEAFADYFVKIEMTPDILRSKLTSEDVDLNLSAGVFFKDEPVGFIFHGMRMQKGRILAYNAGTGVIPAFRGNHFTEKMYRFILPKLQKSEVNSCVLEVMEQNTAALKSYEKCGFSKVTELECFMGKLTVKPKKNTFIIQKTDIPDFKELQKFWDWEPTWQHAPETVMKQPLFETLMAFVNNETAGYITANFNTGRIVQFAVDPGKRNQGIGTALFQKLGEICPDGLSVLNVEGSNIQTIGFLKSLGLSFFLRQFKMNLILNSKDNP